ncbi:MAG: Jag N-terminal domain-containing protein [Proteobacteria bacterium]|nr:Jag N-terminal domain-containing protein [Pseudomonadota bacterium]
MTKVTVTGKNLDLAIMKAASELAIPRSDVAYQLQKESSGFLGLGKKITIEAWQRAKSGAKKLGRHVESRSSSEAMSEEQTTEIISGLSDYLRQILSYGFGLKAEISVKKDVSLEGQRVIFNVASEEFADLLMSDLLLADSLEHLLRKQPRHIKRELPFKIFIDGQFRRFTRESKILDHAKSVADEVVKTGESATLDYDSSYDRKMIHLVLQSDHRVRSKSEGHRARKKVVISPIITGDDQS